MADRDNSGRLRRRLSEKPEQLRICPDPWEESSRSWGGSVWSVQGRSDRIIEAELLDEVTLLGRDGDAEINVDELGTLSNRISV